MSMTSQAPDTDQLYAPSWIDRVNRRVQDLPVRAWIFYAGLGVILVVIQIVILWVEGGFQNVELLPVILFNGLFTPFLLALIQYLDGQAISAMNTMRSVLEMNEPVFAQHKYQLSKMPAFPALVAGLLMAGFVILMEQVLTTPIRYEALGKFHIFSFVFYLIDRIAAFFVGVCIYHTLRQLWLVNTINAHFLRINLFNLRPMQAFSGLTASTAAGFILGIYGWMLINPELFADPAIIGILGIFTILAVLIFLWPLYGTHRRMVAAKEVALREIDQRSEAVYSKFHDGLRHENFSEVGFLNGVIASLDIQHRQLKAIPTWPWRPETAQFVLTAIAVPLVLAILRFLVERAFGS